MVSERAVERLTHEAVNNVRSVRDLPTLQADRDLRHIARRHSLDMSDRQFVGHSTPTGTSLGDRYERYDYDCRAPMESPGRYATGGENIALLHLGVPSKRSDGKTMTYETAEELAHGAVWGWMNSPGHRENLLRSYWRREGIGATIDGTSVYITQNFC
ncbi:CAP domain-containing protein [Halobellus rufus]|uniref:CAP domain-containing protein n=1 Tax=Halobellus rufus TaxID=1448860 RepID=UPI000679C700|nr:CAP domain-containing protein [Halobellus rufus]